MSSYRPSDLPLDTWSFRRDLSGAWEDVVLPHSAVSTDPDGGGHWQGLCEYRRVVRAQSPLHGERFSLYFHGAMHTAEVFLDGKLLARHEGGYLPFEVAAQVLGDGEEHELLVRLDNRDAPDVPPGKPLAELDFCWYGGLYRSVELRRRHPLHVSDAATAGIAGGGGVFVRTLSADAASARISIAAHVANSSARMRKASVEVRVLAPDGTEIASARSGRIGVPANNGRSFPFEFTISNPALWSPRNPRLCSLEVVVRDAPGDVTDIACERFGIRTLSMSRSRGLLLNGERLRPRGTNRHQDHPYVGYALPAAAERRDAVRIKESGFDYVRLSHYPQSKGFLDACDELGILVMDCIPGWQFIGGGDFCARSLENARQMIRRDRNHPCVILWEVSLNETDMPEDFMAAMQEVRREELPADGFYSCGWKDAYDVYIHARQHGHIHDWRNGDKPLVVSEYGDWEYYAENEGFDQKSGRGLLDPAKNSRALPGDSEGKLLRQADNFAEALDDTLSTSALADGQWVMFDYPRGYEPHRASCGVMDFFRLPKFGHWFYRSQRDAGESGPGWTGGPVVFIASRWLGPDAPEVTVFTNADEVELFRNGLSLGIALPSREKYPHLPHPPVVFPGVAFEPGELRAEARIGGKVVARHVVRTPGVPAALRLVPDTKSVAAGSGAPDRVFLRAEIMDAADTPCPQARHFVTLSSCGNATLCGPASVPAEAGIASFLVRIPAGSRADFTAIAPGLSSASCRL